MFQLDVTITATRRPEVLYETLYSFCHNLFRNVKCRAIVNIDPVGPGKEENVVDVVKEFFSIYEILLPTSPSFPVAFHSVWSRTASPFVFHLEDDWKLEISLEFDVLLDIMLKFPTLASLRLPAFPSHNKTMKNWNKVMDVWNGYFYQYKDRKDLSVAGFCGHPSLFRKEFIDRALKLFNPFINPEKQFHKGELAEEVLRWEWGVYGKITSPAFIRDIGREWMTNNKYQKKGNKALFTEWEVA
jgi:hypothetical protein